MGVVRRSRRTFSRGFWILIAAAFLVAAGVRLVSDEHGQAFLARHGVPVFLPELATRLDVGLARCFLDMGLLRQDLRARELTDAGRRVREYAFTSPGHRTPTQCQLEIEGAARRAGAELVRAEQQHSQGSQLVLWLGFGSRATHRVVVRLRPTSSPAPERKRAPRVALIVDDFGHNTNATTRGFLDLGVPVTLAILPDLPRTKAIFEAASKRGIPALLHLPMQPDGSEDPGKNPITVSMSAEDIDAIVERHLRRHPSFIGVNNHMGSKATADRKTMQALMQALKRRDLFFVDSHTTARTQAAAAAREAGVWSVRNDHFLDDQEASAEGVAANLQKLVADARKRGVAIGIAHPRPETLEALRRLLPRMQAEGVDFVGIDALQPRSRVASQESE